VKFIAKHSAETRAAIVALKGVKSASEVGAIYGLTRNSVIGIWDRAGAPRLTVVQLHIIAKRAHFAARQRRKAAAQ
jgi:hypothetical protein